MIADRRALDQILLNLLSNAIRFTDRGGKVVVVARAEAGVVIFTVEDSGVGMSDEDLRRIGEPYFQARGSYDRRHGGTGLGLSIVKGLVRLHGGELSIRSKIGEGTRVTVRLPLDCERGRAAAEPTPDMHRLNGQSATPAADATDRLAEPLAGSEDTSPSADVRVKKSA
jgi:two-component system, cell cycle sensor histidine kinase DivJ